jgi:hypothetical protein
LVNNQEANSIRPAGNGSLKTNILRVQNHTAHGSQTLKILLSSTFQVIVAANRKTSQAKNKNSCRLVAAKYPVVGKPGWGGTDGKNCGN